MPLASQTAESKFMVERGVTGCDSGLSRRSLPKELLLVQGPQICCPGDKASLYHLCHSDPFTAFLSVLTLLIHWTGASRVYRVHWLLRGNARHEPVRSVCSESPTQFYAEDVTHPHHPVQQVLQCGVHCALESTVSNSVYQGLDQRYGVDSPKPSWVGISLSGVITQFWDCWDLSTKEKP
jgi:hypothetical protein